jgi:hypothetical protein
MRTILIILLVVAVVAVLLTFMRGRGRSRL